MGDRPSLMLLCGVGEDEAIWTPVAKALADVADCRSFVGQGNSVEAMAADLLARTEGPIAIAGHSLGGYVALAVHRAAPERVTRLALINSTAAPDDDRARSGRQKLIDLIGRDGFPAVIRRLVPGLAALPVAMDPAAMLARAGENRFVRDLRVAMHRPDGRAGLAAISVPLLVIGGERDTIVPVEHSIEIADAVTHANLLILPDSGHLAPVEAPAAVVDALRDWLAI